MRKPAILVLLALLLPIPSAAAGPGLYEATEDGSSDPFRVGGGGFTWLVTGDADGATIELEASADGGESWATVAGSALTAAGSVTIWIATVDLRITVTGAGAGTDLVAAFRRIPVSAAVVTVETGGGAEALAELTDVSVTGADSGEALVSDGAGAWSPSAAAVCLSSGAGCPADPTHALDDLSDVATAGQASGEALVSNGTTWAPSAAAVCLSDGTNCQGWIDEAGALAASDGATDWLSVSAGVISVDPDADATAELTIREISGGGGAAAKVEAPSGFDLVLSVAGASDAIYFRPQNGDYWSLSGSDFLGITGAPRIANGAGSVSSPNINSRSSDQNSGFWCDGSDTCYIPVGGEDAFSVDNDGTNHVVTATGDTGQASTSRILKVQTSASAERLGVTIYGPMLPQYTVLPACGASEIGLVVGDSDSTPPTACYCDGSAWQPWDVASVGACNTS